MPADQPADLEALVRRVLADVAVVEPELVDGPTAARVLGDISTKTLGLIDPKRTGRVKIGTRTLYRLANLRQLAAEMVGKTIDVTA